MVSGGAASAASTNSTILGIFTSMGGGLCMHITCCQDLLHINHKSNKKTLTAHPQTKVCPGASFQVNIHFVVLVFFFLSFFS